MNSNKNWQWLVTLSTIGALLFGTAYALDRREQEENTLLLPFNELNIALPDTLFISEVTPEEQAMQDQLMASFIEIREQISSLWKPIRDYTQERGDAYSTQDQKANEQALRTMMDLWTQRSLRVMRDMATMEAQYAVERATLTRSMDAAKVTVSEMKRTLEHICSIDKDQMGTVSCKYYQ